MKKLVITEFKRSFKSLILWTSIVAGLAALMLMLYPAFKEAFSQIEEFLSVYPEAFLEAFGMGEGGLDMSDFYGWFGVEGYLFVNLIGGSYAAILGGSILSKEEDDKTIEFLLSKPISRDRILFGKAIVVAVNLLMLNTAVAFVLLIAFAIYGDINVPVWLLFSYAPFLLQMIFASISFFISVFVTKSRKVLSIALGIVIGMYVVDLISKLTDEFEFLKYFTPYEYVNAVTIVNDEMIKPLYLLISVLMIGFSFTAAWFFYRKKDITA
ncbi:MAG: ABC transporter permease subunit [Candidatus Izemoplasmatales bacterium]|nr:ABC transporter permease subunit [Candidatus Izemoplasmatales bacterium]MDD4987423.1 ABC transporter permease subunit [Candidatus Izemoplasmatales bacterium]MDD5601385.1 ABC transporter permease subunit [Candidatus Izemoplasmatales bacterium]